MKISLTILLFTVVSTMALSQKSSPTFVTIQLKNASLLPKKITIISYEPGDTGNGTQGFTLLSGSLKKLTFKEGAKLYVADARQVNKVMSGKRIDTDKPFLILKKEDQNTTFKL